MEFGQKNVNMSVLTSMLKEERLTFFLYAVRNINTNQLFVKQITKEDADNATSKCRIPLFSKCITV